jgi:hypothetical protein
MSQDKTINQTSEKIFKCAECNYQTPIKSNLIRHIKAKHAEKNEKQKIIRKEDIEIMSNKLSDSANDQITSQNDKSDEIDIEDYITDKVQELMKDNNLPNVKVTKSLMRSCFTGTIPSFLAGSFVGYILSSYIPMLLMNMKKKTIITPPVNQMQVSTEKSDTMPLAPLTEA